MPLLGMPLLVVLGGLAIGCPVATALFWSRVRGPSVVRVGARLGMLVACQLTAVALVAALANNYGQFYTSWGDLLGSSGPPPTVQNYGAAVTTADHQAHRPAPMLTPTPRRQLAPATGAMQVIGSTSWSSRSQWATRGQVIQVRITGKNSGLSVPAYVYLPPQYFSVGEPHRSFPVVEVLTGYPGSAVSLFTRMNYPATALALVGAHRAEPMIYVMLTSTVAPPRDTECTNVPGGPQTETFLAAELPSAIAHGLRAEPGNWGIVGYSTGGYCATKLAMHHPNFFAGAVSLSGYYYARTDATTGDLWGGSLSNRHHNDPCWLLAHRPAPPTSLYVTIAKGESGHDGYPGTMQFLRLVKPPMHVTAVIESIGGHNFRTWGREMPQALSWLSDRIATSLTPVRSPDRPAARRQASKELPAAGGNTRLTLANRT